MNATLMRVGMSGTTNISHNSIFLLRTVDLSPELPSERIHKLTKCDQRDQSEPTRYTFGKKKKIKNTL